MGSTLETAIVISVVMAFIVFLILAPLQLSGECIDSAICGKRELDHELNDDRILSEENVGGVEITTTSPEILCTFLTGISENYRLIYGTVAGVNDAEG